MEAEKEEFVVKGAYNLGSGTEVVYLDNNFKITQELKNAKIFENEYDIRKGFLLNLDGFSRFETDLSWHISKMNDEKYCSSLFFETRQEKFILLKHIAGLKALLNTQQIEHAKLIGFRI